MTDTGARPDDGGEIDATFLDATSLDAGTDAPVAANDVGTDGGRDAYVDDTNADAGPACTSSSDCGDPATSFCMFPVGVCGGEGVCTQYGGACPLFFRPVCGCNGHTYTNAVCARQAGQSIQDDTGACAVTPTCGCVHDTDCRGNEECVTTASGGVCKLKVATPMCWRDDDCGSGQTCMGASVCQCGARCLTPDVAGTCG